MNESTATSGLYKAMPQHVKEARLGVTTVVAVLSTALGMGVTWGAYSTRLQETERKAEAASQIAAASQVAQAVTAAQYADIIQRLDRIEQQRK